MKVVVVGAGPSGIMAALEARKNGHDVELVERNAKIGRKLFITGKGRCNLTNQRDIEEFFHEIPRNRNFLYSAFYGFTNLDLMRFFEERGLKLKVERGGRVFPESDRSSDVIDVLYQALKDTGVELRFQTQVTGFHLEEGSIRHLRTARGDITGDWFIVASGGASYMGTGSDGALTAMMKELGHRVEPLRPSLIPLVVKESFVKELQGLSLRNVTFSLVQGGKRVYTELGELLFTHFGVSGPVVLSSSAYYGGGECQGIIDLKPGLSEGELDDRIVRDFAKFQNKDFRNALGDLLPSKLIPVVIAQSGISPDKKCHSITREERRALVNLLKGFAVTVVGTKSLNEAIITRGGVSVKDVDPGTMHSRIVENLSFAGEMLDLDALTGGYNLQIAFSTGVLAGRNVT